jgi:serine/threonine protein kinase
MSLEGQQLNHYQLVGRLGTGGMGDVYLAEDLQNQQQVAIKVIRLETPYVGDAALHEEERLFRREAKAIAKLDHPRILSIYDYGEERLNNLTLFYLVMPYRPEGSFADWLRRRGGIVQLTPRDITQVVQQAADALQHAHAHQVIHQDIKPSNFLVQACGEDSTCPDLILSDFGIARLSTATSNASQSIRGTPTYMAPEQWEGNPVYATDQYGLAIMAYELLTGRPPFQGNAARMMYQHLNTPSLPASSLNPALSSQVDLVLLHALEKQPERRFSSISEFSEAFSQAVEGTLTAETLAPLLPSAVQNDQLNLLLGVPDAKQPFAEKAGRTSHEFVKIAEPSQTKVELSQAESPILPAADAGNAQVREALLTPVTSGNPFAEPIEKMNDAHPSARVGTSVSRLQKKGKWRPLLIGALALVLLSILVIGGVVFALPLLNGAARSALVTLTLESKLEQNAYTISEVAGTPDASKHQVAGIRRLSVTTQTYTRMSNATGQRTSPATNATGILEIDNERSTSLTLSAGTTLQNDEGTYNNDPYAPDIQVALDTNVTVPASTTTQAGIADVNITVVQAGAIGNIPVNDANPLPGGDTPFWHCGDCSPGVPQTTWIAFNSSAFTGGSDSQTYTAVQQSDIDGAVQSLEQAHSPNVQQVLQNQMQANEQIIGTPQCKPNVQSDRAAGDQATSVTVSVSFTCTGEVYNQQSAQTLASQLLAAQAASDLGPRYTLAGNIATIVTETTLEDAKSGTVTLSISARGIWVYQLTAAQQQKLLYLMIDKKKVDVEAQLLKQPGIAAVAISLTGGNGTLFPTDAQNIKIVVRPITGVE